MILSVTYTRSSSQLSSIARLTLMFLRRQRAEGTLIRTQCPRQAPDSCTFDTSPVIPHPAQELAAQGSHAPAQSQGWKLPLARPGQPSESATQNKLGQGWQAPQATSESNSVRTPILHSCYPRIPEVRIGACPTRTPGALPCLWTPCPPSQREVSKGHRNCSKWEGGSRIPSIQVETSAVSPACQLWGSWRPLCKGKQLR